MLSRKKARDILVSLILGYVCLYCIRLYVTGNLGLYVHPRYFGFIVAMSLAALVLLGLSAVYTIKEKRQLQPAITPIRWFDYFVVLVVGLAFLLPAKTLSSRTVGERGIILPTPGQARKIEGCPTEQATSIRAWVFQLSEYQATCNDNLPIELTGHLIAADSAPLPENMFYFGRVVISCCVIDARPYAIPVYSPITPTFSTEDKLRLFGRLRLTTINDQTQFVIDAERIVKITDETKPYEYLNLPAYITQPEVNPVTNQ